MAQRVYLLYKIINGLKILIAVLTTIRQVRMAVQKHDIQDFSVEEIRMNEPPIENPTKDVTKKIFEAIEMMDRAMEGMRLKKERDIIFPPEPKPEKPKRVPNKNKDKYLPKNPEKYAIKKELKKEKKIFKKLREEPLKSYAFI